MCSACALGSQTVHKFKNMNDNLETKNIFDVAIIGCGPGGLSAAVYTARAGLKTVIFGDYTKGNMYKSHIIANYLGFVEPISGPDLTMKAVTHAKIFGTEMIKEEIIDLKINNDQTFILKDAKQRFCQAKSVIIATGQSYALSGIKNEQHFIGKGVSYCVTCDGAFFKNSKLVVIGNGDYAAEEALQLLNYTGDITILSHGKAFIFSDEYKKQLQQSNIKTIVTPRIKEITGSDKVSKLILNNGEEMPAEGIFMAVGVAGAIAFAKKLGLETINNYIKTDPDGKTNIKGLFAAGDCTGSPAQVASSVGNGCNAALSVIKLIRGLKIYIQYN